MSMIDDYFAIYTEKVKEYGIKTAVLYACGSFYELYQVTNDTENIGNAEEIADILHIVYTSKNKSLQKCDRSNPNLCGFNTSYINKYLNILLEHEYTVVIVDQLEDPSTKKGRLVKRGITAIHSPALYTSEVDITSDYGLVFMLVESTKALTKTKINTTGLPDLIVSIISLNNLTGEINIIERPLSINGQFQLVLEELARHLSMIEKKELKILAIGTENEHYKNLSNYFSTSINYIDPSDKQYKEYIKISVQNEYLSKVYADAKTSLVSPVEYLGLEKNQLSTINLMYLLDYVSKHDLKYLNNINKPTIIVEQSKLLIELNTLKQLNINDSAMGVSRIFTNNIQTSIGKRHLHDILCRPFIDTLVINQRYSFIRDFNTKITMGLSGARLINQLKLLLKNTYDFEKLHRKISLNNLQPFEFERLHQSYMSILEIIDYLKLNELLLVDTIPNKDVLNKNVLNKNVLDNLKEYVNEYNSTFDLSVMKGAFLGGSFFFKKGMCPKLDSINESIIECNTSIENIRKYYNNLVDKKNETGVKLGYTDQEGYHLVTTKLRFDTINKKLCNEQRNGIRTKIMSNSCKIFIDELTDVSSKLVGLGDELKKNTSIEYYTKLNNYYNNYIKFINEPLKSFVQIVDLTLCNVITMQNCIYCIPELRENSDSFLIAKDIRHPIIEKINTSVEYVPNDVTLDSNTNGILLYGINSSGKSSLLRAIGISVILAQAGMCVPCSSFVYHPFKTVISQVDLTDDLYAGKSSFINEMLGLKKILQCSGPNTLVLSDEMCKGTETSSSISLVTTTLLKLVKDSTKFFFTTHLHEVSKQLMNCERDQQRIRICHMSINITANNIIYERKLRDTIGNELYGLEVAKSVIFGNNSSEFMDTAFNIRNNITNTKTTLIDTKKSIYNAKKGIYSCEVCSSRDHLETHHIQFQSNCNEKGIPHGKFFHKNELHNLSVLCKGCHDKVTRGLIIVNGYKESINGKYLDYEVII